MWEDDKRFFGQGPYLLLCGIESTGSLRASAQTIGMSYSKAFAIIKQAEDVLGFALIERKTGGKHGGGSCLTQNAKELMIHYEQYTATCTELANRLYNQHFSEFWKKASVFDRNKTNW